MFCGHYVLGLESVQASKIKNRFLEILVVNDGPHLKLSPVLKG